MSLIDIFAAVFYFIGDLLAIFSLIGSTLMFLFALVSRFMGRPYYTPDQVKMWSIGGLFLGAVGLTAIILSGDYPDTLGFFFGYSRSAIAGMFALSSGSHWRN